MPLLPGEILNKRYRIIGLLGGGQYGSTYRAIDIELTHLENLFKYDELVLDINYFTLEN